ncbi:MAG: hypothetical protein ACRBCS_03040 [Cellvibrionaceae bacterium]
MLNRAFKAYEQERITSEQVCCDGYQCGCGGASFKEYCLKKMGDYPPLEYVKIEQREVSEWQDS